MLPLLLPRLTDACWSLTEEYEIILVNDGSTDETWSMVQQGAKLFPRVRGINLARRYGQQVAISAGLSQCRGERILFIDADLQDPPELLPDMMKMMDRGADVVYGQRRKRIGDSWFKKTTAKYFYRFMEWASDNALPPEAGDFRLINRRVLELIQQMPERQRYLRGMIAWLGLTQVPIAYDRQARSAGETHYPLRRMMNLAMDAIASFSAAPLRLSLWFSALCGGFAFLMMLYAFGIWLAGDTVAGWASLACIMFFFFGLQFLCIGLIGEYVGRIYVESKQRPLFVVNQTTDDEEPTEEQ